MPAIQPIPAVCYSTAGDLSHKIAPPYDVLDAESKARLLDRDPHNIVAIDLPHTPAKTLGPDEVYEQAGRTYRQWLNEGVLNPVRNPVMLVYSQIYTVGQRTFDRRGLIANVRVQEFGPAPDGKGGIYPHEQTFSEAKADRLKLMKACQAQLSPIFGLYTDPQQAIAGMLAQVVDSRDPDITARTDNDDVQHRIWVVDDPKQVAAFSIALEDKDVFIADGHHRYNTAVNYRNEAANPRADWCMFVLISMQDEGMIVLPTHRVLGGMTGFSMKAFMEAARGKLDIQPFQDEDLAALEAALPDAGPHAMGLFDPAAAPEHQYFIASPMEPDPLAQVDDHADQSEAWRQLDVAILQHYVVEQILQPTFSPGRNLAWKFPHRLDDLRALMYAGQYQLGVIMQPTPLESVVKVSEANELMPQKSTFFYPKLATGLALNPLA